MRILHVIPSISPSRGGPSTLVKQLAEAQAKAGVEVTVATTDDDGPGRRWSPSARSEQREGVLYRIFPRQLGFYSISLPMARWFNRNLRRFDAVHIHSLFSFPAVSAARAAIRNRVPFVVRPLGTLNAWGLGNRRPWLKRLSLRFVETPILEGARAVHFTSDQEREEAARLAIEHRPVVIPNPVESAPPPTGERDRDMVLFLGRIHRVKGLDLLLPAMAEVIRQRPSTRLVIAGDGDPQLTADLHLAARELGIADHIEWLGAVSGPRKQRLFATAGLFVLPSYSENFGIAAGEALAAGVPLVVSNRVAIHREVTRAGAGLVVPCETMALAHAVERMLGDDDFARHCAEAGQRLAAERYSTAAVTSELIRLYQEISA